MAMVLRLAMLFRGCRVNVVETDQPLAIRSVKGQREVQAMRLLRRHRNPRNHEAHPMAAGWIHNEYLPVKVDKRIEGGIALALGYQITITLETISRFVKSA